MVTAPNWLFCIVAFSASRRDADALHRERRISLRWISASPAAVPPTFSQRIPARPLLTTRVSSTMKVPRGVVAFRVTPECVALSVVYVGLLYHYLVDSLESGTDEAEGVRIRGGVVSSDRTNVPLKLLTPAPLVVLDNHSVDNARGSHLTTSEADTRTGVAGEITALDG